MDVLHLFQNGFVVAGFLNKFARIKDSQFKNLYSFISVRYWHLQNSERLQEGSKVRLFCLYSIYDTPWFLYPW